MYLESHVSRGQQRCRLYEGSIKARSIKALGSINALRVLKYQESQVSRGQQRCEQAAAGAQFTCFTSTSVQILIPEDSSGKL